MELTADEVDTIEGARQIVEDLIGQADETDALDKENLQILEVQLDALHQGLSMAVAQKKMIQNSGDGDD